VKQAFPECEWLGVVGGMERGKRALHHNGSKVWKWLLYFYLKGGPSEDLDGLLALSPETESFLL